MMPLLGTISRPLFLLAERASTNLLSNTYFVFYTDNGSHFGQHRFEHGKLQPYKEDTGFPLIVRGPGIPHGVVSAKPLGNHDIAPTLARMGGANVPAFVDGRSFLALAKDPNTAPWARTAVLSEKETNNAPPNSWSMLRMPGKSYTRYQNDETEFYNLIRDPNQLHNAFGASDTAYPPPTSGVQDYYDRRLQDLYTCSGHGEQQGSCLLAENAPLLPPPEALKPAVGPRTPWHAAVASKYGRLAYMREPLERVFCTYQ